MAAAGGVFNVEFGLNETTLTRALEGEKWDEAEFLIHCNSQTTFLDEGCYQRTPLYITLCGLKESGHLSPRNLYLAKLLVENGASINYRIPATYFGCEYMSPGKTCLELVVEYYVRVKTMSSQRHDGSALQGHTQTFQNWNLENVIGLNKEQLNDYDSVCSHLLKLSFIILANAGDVNVLDEGRRTLLHRVVPHLPMVELLCENGASLNAIDNRYRTPLGSLCTASVPSYSRTLILEYLLQLPDVELDCHDRQQRTPLFHCLSQGDVQSAAMLLKQGCDVTIKGQDRGLNIDNRFVSALFVSLSVVDENQPNSLMHSSRKGISQLVDMGYFFNCNLEDELLQLFSTPCIGSLQKAVHVQLNTIKSRLIAALLGKSSASLVELCVRRLFEQHVVLPDDTDLRPETLLDDSCFILQQQLIHQWNIPHNCQPYFIAHLLFARLCLRLQSWQLDGSSISESDTSSEGGDSDLEYW